MGFKFMLTVPLREGTVIGTLKIPRLYKIIYHKIPLNNQLSSSSIQNMIWFKKSMSTHSTFQEHICFVMEAGEGRKTPATRNEGLKWAE